MQADPNNHFSEPIESSTQLPTITGGGKVEVILHEPKLPVFMDAKGKLYVPIDEFLDLMDYMCQRETGYAKRLGERLAGETSYVAGQARAYQEVVDKLGFLQSQAEGMPSAL